MEEIQKKSKKLENIKKGLVWLIIPIIVSGVIYILEEKESTQIHKKRKPDTLQNLISLTGNVLNKVLGGK